MSLPAMAVKTTDFDQEKHENCLHLQQSNGTHQSNNTDGSEVIEKDNENVQLFTQKEDKGFVILGADANQKAEINNSMKTIDYEVIKKQIKDCKKSGLDTIKSYNDNKGWESYK